MFVLVSVMFVVFKFVLVFVELMLMDCDEWNAMDAMEECDGFLVVIK